MSKFKGECVECGSITSLNQAGICSDCFNDRDENWLESLSSKQAKEFALENLIGYKDENGYYSLKINDGYTEDLQVLLAYIFEEDETILEIIAKESKVYYEKIFGIIYFKSKEDFDVFFDLLINKIKETMNMDKKKVLLEEIKNILEDLDSLGMENAFDGTIDSIPDELYKELGNAQTAVDNMVGILMNLTEKK